VKDQTILHKKVFRKSLCLIWSRDFQLRVAVTRSVTGCWLCCALERAKAEAPARDPAVMTVRFTIEPGSSAMMDGMKIFKNSICCACRSMQGKCNEEQPMGLQ